MILFLDGKPTHPETFAEYCAGGGYSSIERDILQEVIGSGLQGRGGAGFPVGKKWTIAREAPAEEKYVVCNAGEDEPGSFKDRILLEHRQHLVLEGMLLAVRAIRATEAFLYLNETYDESYRRFNAAIQEARPEVKVTIHRAPTVYVAGEDSATLEVLEGKPPKPRQKPPYPATSGLFGKPTIVNNVETLANIPQIVRNGAEWFRGYGTSGNPGTMLFCIGSEMKFPGLYELPLGTPLRRLYEESGGGLASGKKLKAILPGGPSCAFLTPDQLDVHLDPESLKRAGSTLGCGVMRFYSDAVCMV